MGNPGSIGQHWLNSGAGEKGRCTAESGPSSVAACQTQRNPAGPKPRQQHRRGWCAARNGHKLPTLLMHLLHDLPHLCSSDGEECALHATKEENHPARLSASNVCKALGFSVVMLGEGCTVVGSLPTGCGGKGEPSTASPSRMEITPSMAQRA